MIGVTAIAAVLLAVACGVLVGHGMLQRVRRLSSSARALEAGDLTAPLAVVG